jgi:hypothetical protein
LDVTVGDNGTQGGPREESGTGGEEEEERGVDASRLGGDVGETEEEEYA